MNIAVLGTGMVGRTIGSKLTERGHDVWLGSREKTNPAALEWAEQAGERAHATDFRTAAACGEMVFNCTAGMHSLDVLQAAGADTLEGKILVDVANPLDFSHGMPPTLAFCNTESLGERIQRAYPKAKVVKTLNTVNAFLMVNPALLPGRHDVFLCGDDAAAKAAVTKTVLKKWFGWKSVIDLGDITNARGMEMYLPLWVRLWGALGKPMFNIRIVKGKET